MSVIQSVLVFVGAVLLGLGLGFAIFYSMSKSKAKPSVQAPEATYHSTRVPESTFQKRQDTLEVLMENRKKQESKVEEPAVIPVTTEPVTVPVADITVVAPAMEDLATTALTQTKSPVTEESVAVSVSGRGGAVPISEGPDVVSVAENTITVPSDKEPEFPEEHKINLNDELYKELVFNLNIATTPWDGKLKSFKSTSWHEGTLENVPSLVKFQEDIAQAYIDIQLANSIVWVASETGLHSAELDESYKKLCGKIAERLKKVAALPDNAR